MQKLIMRTYWLILMIVVTLAKHGMAQQDSLKFLALGDSYTIGESVAENERWPLQLVRQLRKYDLNFSMPRIIATTGWRTDQLKDAIDGADLEPRYDLVSLLIGVNNEYQGKSVLSYAPEFEALLNTAIELAGGRKENVIVVSIPDYGFTPFGKENQRRISEALEAFNATNKRIAKKHGVAYFDITPISKKGLEHPDLVATDGLHPSGKMYAQWVGLILPHFAKWKPD
jgi:lysophospholipase L1-like esterase